MLLGVMADPNKPAVPIEPRPSSGAPRWAPTPGAADRPAPPPKVAPVASPQFNPPGAEEARRAGTFAPVKVQPPPQVTPPGPGLPPPFPVSAPPGRDRV